MNQSIQSINIFWSWWFSVSSWPMVVVNSSRRLRTIDFLALNQGIAHSSAQFTWVVAWHFDWKRFLAKWTSSCKNSWHMDALCKHLWNTASPTHCRFQNKKVLSTKPSPELRLKVFRFFSRLQSWHSNQKEFVLVTFNGLLHVSLQNRHNKNQLRHTDRGCLSHVVAHVRERSHQKMCQYDALLVVLQASTMYALNGLKSIAAIVWQSVSVVK